MPEKKIVELTARDMLELLLMGEIYNEANDTAIAQPLRLEGDRTLRIHGLMIGDAGGREGLVDLEDDRTPKVVLWGHDGAAFQRLLTETTRQLGIMLWGYDGANPQRLRSLTTRELVAVSAGTDEGNVVDIQRTDPNRIPWRRDFPAYLPVNPVELPAAEGVLWNPGVTAAETYEVAFNIVNNNAGAAAVTVSVGVDIGGGGALAAPEYWLFNETINYPGSSGWRSGYVIRGDDDIRGIASAANVASIHWRIKRCDVGA